MGSIQSWLIATLSQSLYMVMARQCILPHYVNVRLPESVERYPQFVLLTSIALH